MHLKIKKYLTIAFIISLFTAFCGCGIYSLSSNTLDANIKTVSIQYFPNYAPVVQPSLSQVFTEALKTQFLNQTQLNLISNNADIQLEGKITGYTLTPEAISGAATPTSQQMRLTITVSVKYTNRYNHKKDFEKDFSSFQVYDSQKARTSADDVSTITYISAIIVDNIYKEVAEDW